MENREQIVRDGLANMGIARLTPMQEEVIEAVEEHPEVVVLSPTGSGKTLAFLIPIVHHLRPNAGFVQALVLTPTRELALQIEQVFRHLKTPFKVVCCYGGHPFWMEANSLKEAPALLIGTPGRIADHLRRGTVSPDLIDFLVLDEFDKSLELGFDEEMVQIRDSLGRLSKTVLTSATDALEIPAFVGLSAPLKLSYLDQAGTAERLEVKLVRSEHHDKFGALVNLICQLGESTMLVFVNHRDAADRLSSMLLEEGIISDVFHGGLEQPERERSLIKFRNGSIKILVATDLASRGLDIPEIGHVVHYQLPETEEAFIHRNGRTARMKANGCAVLVLAEAEELPYYASADIEPLPLDRESELPSAPEWTTVYIGAGKKDKLSKVDVVGFLIQKGGIEKADIGRIDILDKMAFVAVKRHLAHELVRAVRNQPVKKLKPTIGVSW
ncbi:DEAD/DEAH box helicase [uncultured Acetobacteroides sp.]|uniref:DEAD/DEAH box helicase n=1 Tax=uncultured Acetobacteroides sp. TaxID=1760811 RepID=UPI0029F4FDF2|nr:DEAD/DEAH box helicase [uncultured Acetobacteroides sp.]